MEQELTTAELERGLYDLSNALSSSEWDDGVKDSYFRLIEEEKQLLSNMKWITDKANNVYNHVTSQDIGKFKATYSECMSKLARLQRGN